MAVIVAFHVFSALFAGSPADGQFLAACDSASITLLTLTMAAALRLGVSTETVVLFCAMHVEYYMTNWKHSQMNSMGDEGVTLAGHTLLSVHEGLFAATIAFCVNLYDPFFWRRDVVPAHHHPPPQVACRVGFPLCSSLPWSIAHSRTAAAGLSDPRRGFWVVRRVPRRCGLQDVRGLPAAEPALCLGVCRGRGVPRPCQRYAACRKAAQALRGC